MLNGIFYNAATTKKPTFANFYNQPITPADSEDITAFVIDNPTQLFVGAIDAAAAQAEYGKTYGLTVTAAGSGSETSGQSSSTLTYATRIFTLLTINSDYLDLQKILRTTKTLLQKRCSCSQLKPILHWCWYHGHNRRLNYGNITSTTS